MDSLDEPQTGTVTSPLISATLKFEVLSPQPVLRAEDPTSDLDPEGHFDATMRMLHEEQDNIAGSQSLLDEDVTITQPSEISPTSSPDEPLESLGEPARLWEGVETIVNVMLPDRYVYTQLLSLLPFMCCHDYIIVLWICNYLRLSRLPSHRSRSRSSFETMLQG